MTLNKTNHVYLYRTESGTNLSTENVTMMIGKLKCVRAVAKRKMIQGSESKMLVSDLQSI